MNLYLSAASSTAMFAIFVGGYIFKVAGLANIALVLSLFSFLAGLFTLAVVCWCIAEKDSSRITTIRESLRYPGWRLGRNALYLASIASLLCAIWAGAIFSGILLAFGTVLFWLNCATLEEAYNNASGNL
jgi:hypothetical protein